MDVILHGGAHRTACGSFQTFLDAHETTLREQGIGYWGPARTRPALLRDLCGTPRNRAAWDRAVGRLRMNLAAAERRGVRQLLVSDPRMIGTARGALRARSLYPDIGERMARIHAAFGEVRRVVLQIRAPDTWWSSAMAMLVARGLRLPSVETCDAIACSNRSWRDVITDLSCACPGSEIVVTLFEERSDAPADLLGAITGATGVPKTEPRAFRVNRSPQKPALRRILAERGVDTARVAHGEGRWLPFSAAQGARLRELYADDLFWLRAGADGLAIFTPIPEPNRPVITPAPVLQERGRTHHDGSARRLA
ncbi:hypothetical protein [Cognatishimia sp. F0-27]|uniref:hypothetical protein n=1 Tax=Cognatishimia sp. F0-27 TaxID=2816855 RepID=UPI001D0C14C4|nr:hypothetical protein [Cognatishimia sp. F0-27]MCC1492543.1 hypothetical protein [Cognatishimia sp. F0-27]